ncbi:MAG: hypothetical protein VKL39_16470 [Leptolyngbyaceae bacterium]|nr:hypothetical protein [Leptolyngbyaceae bacterium]
MSRLRNILIGAGVAAVGAVATKKAVDYLKNRGEEETVDESVGDAEEPESDEELAYVKVEPSSVQTFLDKSFGKPGRYVPNRSPKVFEYKGKQYMVIWARDNDKDKNQMMAFEYTDAGREMIASVGYTTSESDYNLKLQSTPFAVDIAGEEVRSGQGTAKGASNVDLVLA